MAVDLDIVLRVDGDTWDFTQNVERIVGLCCGVLADVVGQRGAIGLYQFGFGGDYEVVEGGVVCQ